MFREGNLCVQRDCSAWAKVCLIARGKPERVIGTSKWCWSERTVYIAITTEGVRWLSNKLKSPNPISSTFTYSGGTLWADPFIWLMITALPFIPRMLWGKIYSNSKPWAEPWALLGCIPISSWDWHLYGHTDSWIKKPIQLEVQTNWFWLKVVAAVATAVMKPRK